MFSSFSIFLDWLRLTLAQIPGFATVTSAPYLFRPFLVLVALGVVSGIVGTLVNLRRLEFNAEAMVHSVFPGVVGGAVWGGIDMVLPGAALVAVLVVVALTVNMRRHGTSEAGTAVILTSFFALGIVISLHEGDMSGQLEALMFGRLLEVTDTRALQALVVCLVALGLLLATWKEQVSVAFDHVGAEAVGVRTLVVDIVLNTALAGVVVSSASAVGILLVIGYLVVPGASARLLATSPTRMALISSVLGVLGGWVGLVTATLPWPRPFSPQASVALCVLATFPLSLLISVVLGRTPYRFPRLSALKKEKAAQR